MSWTYSGDPTTSAVDEVRFLIGDNQAGANPTLANEEITYNVGIAAGGAAPPSQGNFLAAAFCAEALMAKYAKFVDSKRVGDLSESFTNRMSRLQTLATSLRRRGTLASVPMYVGGITLSDKENDDTDSDLQQPGVKVDQFNLNKQDMVVPGDGPVV